MVYLITAIHVLVCLFIIIVVLLQSGKSADIAAAFGGAGSQTAFGPRGTASVLSKATTWSAVLFMLTSITLSIFATRHAASSGSVLGGYKPATQQSAPAPTSSPSPTNSPSPNPTTPTPQQK